MGKIQASYNNKEEWIDWRNCLKRINVTYISM